MIIKKEKGLTLVSLTVTIVVLLILGGITVQSITSGEGLIRSTNKLINEVEQDDYSQKTKINILMNKLQ